LLEAVYSHYETTGELLSASEITASLTIGRGLPINSGTNHAQISPERKFTTKTPSKRQRTSKADVTFSAAKTNSETVAKNFLNSMKGLAGGFFD